ncbi:DUF6300 family protein [Streptomyces sp. NPDC055287]
MITTVAVAAALVLSVAGAPAVAAPSAALSSTVYPFNDCGYYPKRSRCSGDLLLHWHGPLITGEWMELCPACDADRPAARAFIRWYLALQRTAEKLPQLFED